MNLKTVFAICCLCAATLVFAQGVSRHEIKGQGKVTVVHAEKSSAPPNVVLKINQPAEGVVVEGPDVTVHFSLRNYPVDKKGDSGPHIHFILDNQPYEPHYSEEPFVFRDVSPGPHAIRAFPGRPWHESIKQESAFAMVQFYVKEKTGELPVDPKKPMLIYSRPKGEYIQNEKPAGQPHPGILVDYFVRNATLSSRTGYSVRATIDGEPLVWRMWLPHYIQGLQPGDHTIKLELLKNGRPVEGNFNTTERTFTIRP